MSSSPGLPLELQSAITQRLQARGGLNAGVRALTETYRAGGASKPTMDFDAYIAARMPATFAAVHACLMELADHHDSFSPRHMIDVGSGPGTASWAAANLWPDLHRIDLVDNNKSFLDLASALAAASPAPALKAATAHHADLNTLPETLKGDLVVAAYTLAELPEAKAGRAAEALWAATSEILLVVEPGTPQGFARLRHVRSSLINQGAHILGPCGHQNACPMAANDWCHFSVRLPRSRAHMHAKQASVPFEDEPYAYVLASRNLMGQGYDRVLRPPEETKSARSFRLCTPDGLATEVIATRNKSAYKQVRKLNWGDRFLISE